MRKALLAALFLFLPLSAESSEQPLGVEEFTNMDGVASAISVYFPKVQGTIRSVKGDRVAISVGRKQGLLPGMRLLLWREGKELRHPVSGAVIGREEQEIGSVEITAVEASTASGVISNRTADPTSGDIARITPKKIRLAVIPLRTDRPELLQALADRLHDSGRFDILDAEKRDAFLTSRILKDNELVKEMGRAFDLDAAVTVGIYPSDGAFLVTVKIFYAQDVRLLDTVVAKLKLEEKKGLLGTMRPHFAPTRAEAASSHDLPVAARSFGAGDFDADGMEEQAFSDGERLSVYREEASGWRDIWSEPATDRKVSIRQLFVDGADINGNKKPEVYVAAVRDGKTATLVLEDHDGAYRVIAELPGLFRVISSPGKGLLLIGQEHTASPTGSVRQYMWTGSAYLAGDEFPLPKGVGLYDFVLADFGASTPFLVALDDANRLVVYSGGKQVWKSEDDYPAADKAQSVPGAGRSGRAEKMTVGRRIASVDLNSDGKDEIVVARNRDHSYFKGYTKADLAGLEWSGTRFEQVWDISDIPGAVRDLQIVRGPAGAPGIKVLVLVPGGMFSKDAARLLTFSGN
ncbi:MAG: hypothetical protein A2X56_07515 [Nitrospirae bacterium GWC2_57_13]|nr:MAG: hypothetical protein A2072_00995 [Nitrospirae bacterium GWC1_57_7]OGW28433.1 MAG: hypothetical protein A2X56_07515 [Nitrospirae bacterium GWC2_57_13]OGW43038.1 MAG: hypothetical protein A2X57_00085 [Nitrospirae bacterium GWD2_57_8]HAR45693.1 hypothetical protein [Nitrospiraceae bacterium]